METNWDDQLLQLSEAIADKKEDDDIEIDVRQTVWFLKTKFWRIVAVSAIFVLAIAIWIFFIEQRSYQATEKLYITGAGNSIVDLSDLQLGSSLASDYKEVFKNKEIHEKIRQKMHLEYTDDELDQLIDISNPAGTRILVVTATGASEFEAMRLVEEYSEAARLFIEDRMGGRIPSIFEKATSVKPRRWIIVRSLIAAVLGAAIAFFAYLMYFLFYYKIFDKRVLEEQLHLTILGVIPAGDSDGGAKARRNGKKGK